jgi:two-component system, cell cycle sensor histidine kinase and response regulator CckA
MNDQDKTREQLLQELTELRARIAPDSPTAPPADKGVSGFFMGLLQHAPTPIYVKSADKHFLLVNRAWEELFGIQQEAVVGRHVSEVMPAKLAEEFSSSDDQVIRTGQPLAFEEHIDFPDGRRFYHTVKFPLRGIRGQIKAVGGISIDITGKKQTENAVRQSEERYRLLFERNLAAVYRATPTGKLLDCNDAFARMLGRDNRADMLGLMLGNVYSQPADWEAFQQRIARERSLTNYESCLRRCDGNPVYTLGNVSLTDGQEGSCLQGTLIDISERWRTRQDLIAERHLLRTLMDTVPDPIYFKDCQSRFTRINKAQSDHCGFADPAEAIGRTDFDVFSADHAQRAMADESRVMRTGQPIIGQEEKETWPDGRITWAISSKMPLRNSDGTIVGTFGISRDITRRKLAEEALRESEERHRIVSKLTSDYVYSVRFDQPPPREDEGPEALMAYRGFRTEWVTEAFERVTGYAIQEVEARGGWLSCIHPIDLPVALAGARTFLRGERCEVEYRIITKSGAVRWLRDFCQPVWDLELQRTVRVFGGVQDITQRKQAEEALRESEALYRVLFEKAPIGLGIADVQGKLITFNDAILKPGAYTREDIARLGNVGALYFDPGTREQVLGLVAQQGSLHRHEVRYQRKDGSPYTTLLDLIPVSIQGKICHLAMVEDVTERKGLEEQLRQAQKMEAVGQLAGGIAHDFNNLLTAILGNVSLLLAAVPDHEPNRDLLRDIERAASRATELTGQLLGYSRQTMLRLEPTNVNSVIRETVAILRWTIDPRISVVVETEPAHWPVQADPGQINQVLMNLCLNARDAMPHGGRLTLEAANVVIDEGWARKHLDARPGEFVRVRVTDTGHGIPAEIRSRIFDPFFTTKEPGKGTGLGLAMVFGILKQHQGWIDCQSEVGHGTAFDIYLPRSAQEALPTAEAPSVPATPGGGEETILLVDDEAIIRNLGRTILQRYGYSVLLAEDGLDAVEQYRRRMGQIDLVILDLTMPRLSGRDTLRQLLQMDPRVRVLFSSGYSAEQIAAPDREGVLGFVNKPYRPQELAQSVRAVLDQQRK